jgi:hypothetical protein
LFDYRHANFFSWRNQVHSGKNDGTYVPGLWTYHRAKWLGKHSPKYIKLMQAQEKNHKEIMERANPNKYNEHTLLQKKVVSEQL